MPSLTPLKQNVNPDGTAVIKQGVFTYSDSPNTATALDSSEVVGVVLVAAQGAVVAHRGGGGTPLSAADPDALTGIANPIIVGPQQSTITALFTWTSGVAGRGFVPVLCYNDGAHWFWDVSGPLITSNASTTVVYRQYVWRQVSPNAAGYAIGIRQMDTGAPTPALIITAAVS